MADEIDEAAARVGSTARAEDREEGIDRAKAILAQLVDATRSAVEAMLDDQKQRAAKQVDGIAEAVRCAAQCFERSDSRAIARYADRAADQIEDFSLLIRDRRWSEIAADAEDFARRRPLLFILGATAAGFLAGRLLSVPAARQRPQRDETGEANDITAVVSHLAAQPVGGDGRDAGYDAEISGGPEAR